MCVCTGRTGHALAELDALAALVAWTAELEKKEENKKNIFKR